MLPARAENDLKSPFHFHLFRKRVCSWQEGFHPPSMMSSRMFFYHFLYQFHFFSLSELSTMTISTRPDLFQNAVWQWGLSPHKVTCPSPSIPSGYEAPGPLSGCTTIISHSTYLSLMTSSVSSSTLIPVVPFLLVCFKHATGETLGSPLILPYLYSCSQSSIPYNLSQIHQASQVPVPPLSPEPHHSHSITTIALRLLPGLLAADLSLLQFIVPRPPS